MLRTSVEVYYWVQGLEAIPYHLGECIEFVESCGYRKLFKPFKVLKRGRTVSWPMALYRDTERSNGIR